MHPHDQHAAGHTHQSKNIGIAFFLNLFFALIEFVGGWWTNSMAIYSDAIHDLGDSLSLGTAWYFQKISKKGRDKDFSYGYKRFSVLGAIINAIILVTGSTFVLTEALPRLFNPVQPDTQGMIALAILGVLVNGIAAFKLMRSHSLNERVVYLHLLEDILGWVATLAGALVMHLWDMPDVDAVLSIAIALFILFNVFRNLKEAVKIIMQATPPDIDPRKVTRELKTFDFVKDVHDCHIWTLDGQYHILSIHLVLDKKYGLDELATFKVQVKTLLKSMKLDHSTIEFETEEEDCVSC